MRITSKAKIIIPSVLLVILMLTLPILFNPIILSYPVKYTEHNGIVYFGDEAVEGINAGEWKITGEDIVKDSLNVFYRGKRVEGIDAATFHEVERPIYADKHRLYYTNSNVLYGRHKLQSLKGEYDIESFEALGYYSAAYKDKNGIYIQRNRLRVFPTSTPLKKINVEKLDISSFRSLETPGWHVDNNHVYFVSYGEIKHCAEIDRASFEVVSPVVSKDKNNVYYLTHYAQTKEKEITSKDGYAILAGADANTFVKCSNGSTLVNKGRTLYSDKYGSWVYELRTIRKGGRRKAPVTISFLVRSAEKCK